MAKPRTEDTDTEWGATPNAISFVERRLAGSRYVYSLDIEGDESFKIDDGNEEVKFVPQIDQLLYPDPSRPVTFKSLSFFNPEPDPSEFLDSFWKAQYKFRGLPVTEDVQAMRDHLLQNPQLGLTEELASLRDKMREQFDLDNEVAVRRIWSNGNDDEKAKLWPARFIIETFGKKAARKLMKVVTMDEDSASNFKLFADIMGVYCEVSDPIGRRDENRVLVVGFNQPAVSEKMADIDDENLDSIEKEREREAEKRQRASDKVDRALADTSNTHRPEGLWNVTGTWDVVAPLIERDWEIGEGLTLELQLIESTTNPDKFQMYATFDFGAVTGIMRFTKPKPAEGIDDQEAAMDTSAMEDVRSDDDTGPNDEDDEVPDNHMSLDSDEEDDEEKAHEKWRKEFMDPAQFILDRSLLPSSSSHEFQYRWRGEETGENQIQGESDEYLCNMTLASEIALSGTFYSWYIDENVKFKAIKRESPRLTRSQTQKMAAKVDPEHEWKLREDADLPWY